jgi:hypothetical protein
MQAATPYLQRLATFNFELAVLLTMPPGVCGRVESSGL